jgi:hypothetical protein
MSLSRIVRVTRKVFDWLIGAMLGQWHAVSAAPSAARMFVLLACLIDFILP